MISIYDGGIDFRAVSTDVKPTDGTSGGPRIVNFALKNVNNDLYIDNGEVRPTSFTVYMWRRTA